MRPSRAALACALLTAALVAVSAAVPAGAAPGPSPAPTSGPGPAEPGINQPGFSDPSTDVPALPAIGTLPPPPHTPADLARLTALLQAATSAADAAAADVEQAALRQISLRIGLDRAAERLDEARSVIIGQVRAFYEAGTPSPWAAFLGTRTASDIDTGQIAAERTAVLDAGTVTAVGVAQHQLDELEHGAAASRALLLAKAQVVETAQARARALLDEAEQAYAGDQALLAQLASTRAALDAQSQQVTGFVAPAVTARGLAAAAAEAPIIALMERTPSGSFPAGYHATSVVLQGVASWYGPGFVGNPTATGAPYDPERLTAAMLALPLGTVVHVTGPTGSSVNVLVDDRGPYVAGRIIDLSAAAARAIGVSLAPVTVQVLEPD